MAATAAATLAGDGFVAAGREVDVVVYRLVVVVPMAVDGHDEGYVSGLLYLTRIRNPWIGGIVDDMVMMMRGMRRETWRR